MEHCCESMDFLCKRDNTITCYIDTRGYRLLLDKADQIDGTHERLEYCPWCGSKLPEDLTYKIEEVLEKEYGITDPWDTEEDKVPAEFHTDEWWKKRGL